MEFTILGSGGCAVIPKPMCRCRVCEEARLKGVPYERTGPSLFVHDEDLLIDTPAEIVRQLNRSNIQQVRYLTFTHLDPDHVEGFRVVEQIALDFRSWQAYADRVITLLLPEPLNVRLKNICSAYGPLIDFYEGQGFVRRITFQDRIRIGSTDLTAIPVEGDHVSFVLVLTRGNTRVVYAPCDIKPFPEYRTEVRDADLLVIQPGIFEHGLRHGFIYPKDHISRKTLYTFEDTLAVATRIRSRRVLFVHLEEYWHRSYDDYGLIEKDMDHVAFAYDGMSVKV